MTLKAHKARFEAGQWWRCVDHWIPARVGVVQTITRAGATVVESEVEGKPYRAEHPKASELVTAGDRRYRVETAKPDGRPMWWEWELVA